MRSFYLPPAAYEFACKSAACAPPNKKGTGGTGGSLKGDGPGNSGRAPHSAGQTGRPWKYKPPTGLRAPNAPTAKRAPHSKGQGRKFPAPTGPNRTKEHDQSSKEHAQKEMDDKERQRQKEYAEQKKAQLAKLGEINKDIREKYLAKVAAEEGNPAEDEEAKAEARRAASRQKRKDDRAAAAKRSEEILKKHLAERATKR